MKKSLAIMIIAAILVALCSCGKEPIADESGKAVVNIYSIDDDVDLGKYIKAFNAQSEEYFVKTKVYDVLPAEDGVWDSTSAATRFRLELISGKARPDMIADGFLSAFSENSFDIYADKGLLEDLYVLMDNDPDCEREDYLQNVLAAFERNGGLYKISPKFEIMTAVGKESDLGSNCGWSLDEFERYLLTKPDMEYIINSYDGPMFARLMTEFLFYDYDTDEINFDREEFFKLLRICEQFPRPDYKTMDYDDLFREGAKDGNPLMLFEQIDNFRKIRELETLYFGEPVVFKGLPASENGSFICPRLWLSIMKNAPQKAGAWEFVKFVMDNADVTSDRFPVKRAALEEMAAQAKQNPKDENGKTSSDEYIYQKLTPPPGGKLKDPGAKFIDVLIGNNTDEDNARVFELLNSVSCVWSVDRTLKNIVSEETDAYFYGGKSAVEAADIIEDRLSLYLAEKR